MTKTTISDAKAGRHPDRKTCYEYLREYGTPPHVIGHCKAVAAVGYTLGKAMNEKGFHMDLDLILAASLLHDMARVEDMHWEAAANWCKARGMDQEADIIRVHMHYDPFHDVEHFDETDVVCLADRVVQEDRFVGIEQRMQYIVDKAVRQGHPEHKPHILRKMGEAKELIGSIEAFLGCSLAELMRDLDYENVEQAQTAGSFEA